MTTLGPPNDDDAGEDEEIERAARERARFERVKRWPPRDLQQAIAQAHAAWARHFGHDLEAA